MQARQILRDGGPATVRTLQEAPRDRQSEPRPPAHLRTGQREATPHSSAHRNGSDSLERTTSGAGLDHDGSIRDHRVPADPPPDPTPVGDTWEAVRARYRARTGEPNGLMLGTAAEDSMGRGAASLHTRGRAQPVEIDAARPRRVRRNQYGDE